MIFPTVLIADDDPSFRRSLRRALEDRHLQVAEARTGADVLWAMERSEPFAAVVVGSMLPDTTGVALIGRLAALENAAPAVLVCESVRGEVAFQEVALDLGARFTAAKSDDIGELAERIDKLVSDEREKLGGEGSDGATSPSPAFDSASRPPPPLRAPEWRGAEKAEEEFEDELGNLIASYLSELPSRLDELEREVESSISQSDTSSPEKAARMAHRLRGSAGTYGFTQISQAAGAVEDALREVKTRLGDEPESQAVDWERLRQLLARLRELVDELVERVGVGPVSVGR